MRRQCQDILFESLMQPTSHASQQGKDLFEIHSLQACSDPGNKPDEIPEFIALNCRLYFYG